MGSKSYKKFIVYIEEIEKRYNANPSEYNLLDLLFTLLAQDENFYEVIKEITGWKTVLNYSEYIVTGDVDTTVKALRHTLNNLEEVFDDRRFGTALPRKKRQRGPTVYRSSLVDERQKVSNKDVMKRGSLMYLLQESHSTSRRMLHNDVEDFLTRLGAKK